MATRLGLMVHKCATAQGLGNTVSTYTSSTKVMHEINAAYSGFITSIPTQRFRRLSVKAAGCHGYLSQPVSDAEAPMLNVTVR